METATFWLVFFLVAVKITEYATLYARDLKRGRAQRRDLAEHGPPPSEEEIARVLAQVHQSVNGAGEQAAEYPFDMPEVPLSPDSYEDPDFLSHRGQPEPGTRTMMELHEAFYTRPDDFELAPEAQEGGRIP